jgi:perosamine synthetase
MDFKHMNSSVAADMEDSAFGQGIEGRINDGSIFSEIKHSSPFIDEEDIGSLINSASRRKLATGEIVKRFEREMSEYLGRRHAAALNSGASSLFIALKSLGIKESNEVIIPSFVCNSVIGAVIDCNASPVLADINKHNYNISLEDTKKKVNEKTKAIILPHMFGQMIQDIDSFIQLGIPIIEDAALSLGSEKDGKKSGSFGTLSILSFYATKMMTTGHGGMVLTDNNDIFEKIKDLTRYDRREEIGECYNYSLSDLQASLGISQLKKLDNFVDRRKEIAKRYTKAIKESCPDISLPDHNNNAFHRYIIRTKEKERFISRIRSQGINVQEPIFRPIHDYFGYPNEEFPNSTLAYKEAVSIPIYPSLTDFETKRIINEISNWKKETRTE